MTASKDGGRRSKEERRQQSDRRKEAAPIDHDERRKGDRRTGVRRSDKA